MEQYGIYTSTIQKYKEKRGGTEGKGLEISIL